MKLHATAIVVLTLLATATLLLLLPSQLAAQQSEAPPAEEIPNRAPPRKPDPKVEPWMRSQILDKGAIAEDTARRLVGLRESGNPHLPEGSFLKEASTPPLLSEEELEELRDRQIRAITDGRHKIDWSPPVAAEPVGRNARVADRPTPPPVESLKSGQWRLAVLGCGLLAFLLILRKRSR